jgi:DNA-binding winged helix-turn-helix (wHTH) protein
MDERYRIAGMRVDREKRQVWRGLRRIELPELSFRLLDTLATAGSAGLDRAELLARVWGGRVVSDDTLKKRVSLLKHSLGQGAERVILSRRSEGYRIAAPVRKGWGLMPLVFGAATGLFAVPAAFAVTLSLMTAPKIGAITFQGGDPELDRRVGASVTQAVESAGLVDFEQGEFTLSGTVQRDGEGIAIEMLVDHPDFTGPKRLIRALMPVDASAEQFVLLTQTVQDALNGLDSGI